MVMPIPPRTVSCKQCGWKKNIPQTSDCLQEGLTAFEACLKCGNSDLDVKYNTKESAVLNVLLRLLPWK